MGYNDYDGFDDFDDDRGQQNKGPKGLRDAYDALKAKFEEQSRALEKATGQIAQRNLRDVLADKGLRPGLARVIAREEVDLSDAKAIDAWLSDPANQEDFGFSLEGGSAPEGGANDGSPEGAGEHADYAANLAKIQGASNGALPGQDAKLSQAHAQIKGAKTDAELQAALDAAIASL